MQLNLGRDNYLPCIRWKMGEYQALLNLSSFSHTKIIPIIEIPEIGFDFEKQQEIKSIDEHLQPFAKRVRDKWGIIDKCFVDVHLIEAYKSLTTGMHPVAFIFNDLRLNDVYAIPVMRYDQEAYWQDAIQRVVDQDNRGFCLRIDLENAIKPVLKNLIDELLQKYNRRIDECDLLLDEVAPNFEPLGGFVLFLEQIIKKIPYLNEWRSFSIIGTSIPPSLSVFGRGVSIIPRYEWEAYKSLCNRLNVAGIRIPSFGDYVVNNPEVLRIDPRIMKATANIRYTIPDQWFIVRGRSISKYGSGQNVDLCREIIKSKFYMGRNFSEGDKYIYDCAMGRAGPGNLTTWRRVGTSHHLESVTRDVANFAGSLGTI